MKKRDLINLIQTKANEIEIKDLSQSILERAKHLPEPIIEPKKTPFYLRKPAFVMSFVTLTAVLVFMFMLSPGSPNIPTFDDVDMVFANSSMTSITLLSATLDDELSNDSIHLSSIPLTHTYQADEHVDQVLEYLATTESLLSNILVVKEENVNGYQYHLQFTVIDLLGEEVEYHLYYNQSEVIKNSLYSYDGYIEVSDLVFNFKANAHLGETNSFNFRIDHENQESVTVNYQNRNDQSIYQVERLRNNVSNQKVEIRQTVINEENQVMVNFIEGTTKGTYAFSKKIIDERETMMVQYLIRGEEDEDGEMIITPNSSSEIEIEIRPRGKAPIVIERGRRPGTTTPGRGNPFLTHI